LESVLASYDAVYGLKSVALRYFNAAGATETLGEHHEPESHLIPNVLLAASGKHSEVSVFGNAYPTPDGTTIRDYVHVSDLAEAHARALDYLRQGSASEFLNLASGRGYSVLEVIECVRQVTGRPVRVHIGPARPGDPSRLVADSFKAQDILSWSPRYSDLPTIVRTAWNWHLRHPRGYAPGL
jgi:UDP-glucose 4-epimerase